MVFVAFFSGVFCSFGYSFVYLRQKAPLGEAGIVMPLQWVKKAYRVVVIQVFRHAAMNHTARPAAARNDRGDVFVVPVATDG